MFTETEAVELISNYKSLKDNYKNSKTLKNLNNLRSCERTILNKFDYVLGMRVNKYKKFSNHEDLYQEARIALFKSIDTYESEKGSIFWWVHKYINTKVKRSANLHTTIRVPLKEANLNTPHKEFSLPLMIEDVYCPDLMAEKSEKMEFVRDSFNGLNERQKTVISLIYGIDSEVPTPLSQVCLDLGISRIQCLSIIKNSLSKMKSDLLRV